MILEFTHVRTNPREPERPCALDHRAIRYVGPYWVMVDGGSRLVTRIVFGTSPNCDCLVIEPFEDVLGLWRAASARNEPTHLLAPVNGVAVTE